MGREGFGPFKQFTYQLYDLRQITHVSDPQSHLQYNRNNNNKCISERIK